MHSSLETHLEPPRKYGKPPDAEREEIKHPSNEPGKLCSTAKT